MNAALEPHVDILRGGEVESVHRLSVAVVSTRGDVLAWGGDPERAVYWRSAAKPFQAWAMVDAGAADALNLQDEDLAIACASHGGEPCHVHAASHLLQQAGFAASDLRCGVHLPLHEPAATDLLRQGLEPGPLHNNCSGNHAGMLALSRHLGGTAADYLTPGGPAQTAILEAISRHSGRPVAAIRQATDGCSAPTFLLPLSSLARAYAALATALAHPAADPSLARLARAMTGQPHLVAGTGRLDTVLMQAGGGRLIVKMGAEGVTGLGAITETGIYGVAVKVGDGAERARLPLTLEVVSRLHLLDEAALDGVKHRFTTVLRNHRGMEVGSVRVKLALQGSL